MRSDLTAGYFNSCAAGHEPFRNVTGSARFDVVAGQRTERWLVTIDKGDMRVSRGERAAGSVLRADKASFDRVVAGELNLMAAVLRGEVAVEGDAEIGEMFVSSGSFQGRRASEHGGRPPARRGGRNKRRARQDPRWRHVRGQRRARRHRGIADRSDGAVLVRHAVPLPVGADRERRAAESALGRRPSILRNALLPRARYRDRVRRCEAIRDPPARGRQWFSRGADASQPSSTNRSI